jgi:hypothetical protein
LSDIELLFYIKSIGVKGDKFKFFINLGIAPNMLVFRAVAIRGIVSKQSLPHDDASVTRSYDLIQFVELWLDTRSYKLYSNSVCLINESTMKTKLGSIIIQVILV